MQCKNDIVKITNSIVITVARNNGNCSRVGCYDYIQCTCTYYTTNYNLIIAVSNSLHGLRLIDLQRSKINILIRFSNLLCADIRHDI